MPELPDVAIYVESLARHVVGRRLLRTRVKSPFVLRSVTPPLSACEGRTVRGIERLGKRIVIAFEGDLFLVVHLMISGRLRWRASDAAIPATIGLAAFDFESGTLLFTEASKKKRASLHVVAGRDALAQHDRGGLEPLVCTASEFAERLRLENHTLKRALTDPTLFSGIGNAYSDEILHRARLSPVTHTRKLDDDAVDRLFQATRTTLTEWIERTRAEVGDGFPEDVTAFRPQMAVHGKFGKPCPDCGTKVQRIVYAENESNYCPTCQTGGKLLADRALSRLLRGDWPKTVEELEERKKG